MAGPTPGVQTVKRRGVTGAAQVAVASLLSAGVNYLVMWLGARTLSTADTTYLLTFLAVLFTMYGVLSGVATETTRSVASSLRDGNAVGPRLWVVALAAGVVSSTLVLALAPWWQERVLHGNAPLLVAAVALGVLGYAFHSVLVGGFAGSMSWEMCAGALGAEALTRLVASLVVVVLSSSVVPLAGASVLGAFAWIGLGLVSRRTRSLLTRRADCSAAVLARRVGAASGAQAASALLVVGFPAMLAATTDQAEYELGAPLLLAIALTRAPILIPLNAYQGMAISHLVHAGPQAGRLLSRLLVGVALVAATGAALAWWLGPSLMVLLFGERYEVSGGILAALTVAAAAIAALTFTGASAQAKAAHGWFLGGWLVALTVTVLLLAVPGSMEERTVLSLTLGPLAGLAVHTVGFLSKVRHDVPEVSR